MIVFGDPESVIARAIAIGDASTCIDQSTDVEEI